VLCDALVRSAVYKSSYLLTYLLVHVNAKVMSLNTRFETRKSVIRSAHVCVYIYFYLQST